MTTGPTRPLGSLALVRGGLRGFDYHRCCDELVEAADYPRAVPVVTPGNVRAYGAQANRPVRLAGRDWTEPCLPRRPDVIPANLWELFAQPKVVVKGVGARPTAGWRPDPAALFVAVWGVWGEEGLLWAVLGLLNSWAAAWLHYQQLATARIPHGSLRVPMAWVAEFPLPRNGTDEIAELARKRLLADTAKEQEALQARIDRAVARAHDLTEAELRAMERTPLRPVQA
jgi:hypothetical protein